jgi:hypothetical protein
MLQLKPNKWSCSITSLAMALNIPVANLIEQLGHDGSEIVFPDLDEPMCRRGFHSQELIHLAWRHRFTVTPFELIPTIAPTSGEGSLVQVHFDGSIKNNWHRFLDVIKHTSGILEGQGRNCNHAVHYRQGDIYDPDGHYYRYTQEACEEHGFFGRRALIISPLSVS